MEGTTSDIVVHVADEAKVSDEDSELQDLYRLLSTSSMSSSRGRPGPTSTVPTGVIAKLSCAVENQQKAAQVRREQAAREQAARKRHEEAVAAIRQRSSASRLRNERTSTGLAVDDLRVVERNRARADAVAAEIADLEVLRQQREDAYMQRQRERVAAMRGNDARLDAQEEEAARTRARQGTEDRQGLRRRAEDSRAIREAENKERVEMMREERLRAAELRASEAAESQQRIALQAKADLARWQEEMRMEEERRLSIAAECRARSLAFREGAALAKEEMVRQRQQEVREELRASRAQVAGLAYEREATQHANQTRYRAQVARRSRSGAQAVASLAHAANASARMYSARGGARRIFRSPAFIDSSAPANCASAAGLPVTRQ